MERSRLGIRWKGAGAAVADVFWPLQPATAAKHRLYRRFLAAWWPILLQRAANGYLRPRVTYLDAFAGPGRYKDGEEGSPIFALRELLTHGSAERMLLSRDRVRLLFMERDRARFDSLRAELVRNFGSLDDLPVWPQAFKGDAGTETESLLGRTGAWGHPVLAVFDSWGNVNVPLRVIERIARNPSSEVIITFGPNWFSRRESLEPEQFDLIFGGRQYWEPAEAERRPDEQWRVWLSAYKDALKRAGFGFQLQFEIVPRTGLPLYLVFGTTHWRGVEVMKDAMWDVDGDDGMGFADPRTRGAPLPGQGMLWGGSDHPEVAELARQRLEQGPASLEDLGMWLLTETSRWRRKDARAVVATLQDLGDVSVSPGRLTKASAIRLR